MGFLPLFPALCNILFALIAALLLVPVCVSLPGCVSAVLEIDALGTFNMSRAAFAALKQSGDAAIINISATLHYGATWYQVSNKSASFFA